MGSFCCKTWNEWHGLVEDKSEKLLGDLKDNAKKECNQRKSHILETAPLRLLKAESRRFVSAIKLLTLAIINHILPVLTCHHAWLDFGLAGCSIIHLHFAKTNDDSRKASSSQRFVSAKANLSNPFIHLSAAVSLKFSQFIASLHCQWNSIWLMLKRDVSITKQR